ncbi:MAG: Wzz/FepE/Etk N-terminal domain-containing protein [Candidatus Glassbacteria bacterium]
MAEKSLDLIGIIRLVLRRWLLVSTVCAVVGAASAVVNFFYLPRWFESAAVIMPPEEKSAFSSLGMLLSRVPSLPGGISRIASGIGAISQSQYLFVVILNSETVADSLVDKFDLRRVYDKKYFFEARKELRSHTKIDFPPEGQVVIKVEAKEDSVLARDLAREYFVQLNNVLTDRGINTASLRRKFLEERLLDTRTSLVILEDSLKNFQENRGVALPIERPSGALEILTMPVKGSLEILAMIEAEKEAKEIALKVKQTMFRATHPDIVMLQKEITELERTIRRYESQLPEIGLDFARLYRSLRIQEELYLLLSAQYEETRLNEADNTPAAVLLDEPQVPEYKYRPRRMINVLISVGAALVLLVAWIVLEDRSRLA